MQTQAAILVEQNRIVIDEISLPPLKPGQVLVEIKYSGVCHTQLLEVRGHRGHDAYLPHCLGHEGSGIVLEVGAKVEKVKPGDTVILSWIKGSGNNVAGSVFDWKGQKVNAGAITTFSRHSVVSENRLTVVPSDFPLKEAALLGCAIPTGLGVVLNTAQPKAGESLAVFGCGGIGLCALLGAQVVGCVPRIAIDLNPQKLALAKSLGATHCINASEEDPVAAIQKIGPLDYAIEASGSPIAMSQALQSIRAQGGTAVIVGNARFGQQLSIDPKEFNQGKRILGTWGGDNQPDLHFPRYCNLIRYGHLQMAPFTKHVYSLGQIDQALQDLESGLVLRPLLDMSL
ncbi:MAG TPA: zinc-binding dehydrogenase [Chlamydiales bacterium]|jgi:S-(hydroxymethyl)glutathione dehydrogenase/alcohol dehydrogenase